MPLTRGTLLDRVQLILGDEKSTKIRTYLEESLNSMLFYLYDYHDWTFKHKNGTFTTVADQEIYDLSTSTPDIRSAHDIEILYDNTNGRRIRKVNLQEIKQAFAKEDFKGTPRNYAVWGQYTIHLNAIPNAENLVDMKYLYVANPAIPTQDTDDLESVTGLPRYMHHVLEKLVLADAMLYYDDTRYTAIQASIEQVFMPRAIQADMKHLEGTAAFQFWDEESGQSAFDEWVLSRSNNDTWNF